ncbi:kinase-like domain-containing protein [Ampelomyces quisqualis]|uniref:Kinase-like domain-containing protein n=1 Tax=Ampelomyces quisqualis TaxID=50730 RepID=A0A6A5Q8U8_AMPQU|nr:kinase-like domain-containing protein [Ampelomyces quisqualis]
MARLKTLLGEKWDPQVQGDITAEYVICTPLLNSTFHSIITKQRTLSTIRIEDFFCAPLQGVAFLHDHSFYHRDIKPNNILIRAYDPPKAVLCEFGCMSDLSDIMYNWPGTVQYLAPKQQPGFSHDPTVNY